VFIFADVREFFRMTVHGQRSKSPESVISPLVTHQNGYISQVVYPHIDMNRSWNGFVLQVSPLSNGSVSHSPENQNSRDISRSMSDPEKSGHYPTWSNSHTPKYYLQHQRTSKLMGNSLDEEAYLTKNESFDEETEYVTLDNNYIFPARTLPTSTQSKHLSLLDYKRNNLNGSIKPEHIRVINNQISLDKNGGENNFKEKLRSRRSLKKIAENIGSVLTPRTGGSISARTEKEMRTERMGRGRSKSVGDLRQFEEEKDDDDDSKSCCYSDDDDGDDFGFLSYPWASSCVSLAMSKNKSPSQGHKILPKKWRSKTKPLPGAVSCMWSPQVSPVFFLFSINQNMYVVVIFFI